MRQWGHAIAVCCCSLLGSSPSHTLDSAHETLQHSLHSHVRPVMGGKRYLDWPDLRHCYEYVHGTPNRLWQSKPFQSHGHCCACIECMHYSHQGIERKSWTNTADTFYRTRRFSSYALGRIVNSSHVHVICRETGGGHSESVGYRLCAFALQCRAYGQGTHLLQSTQPRTVVTQSKKYHQQSWTYIVTFVEYHKLCRQ